MIQYKPWKVLVFKSPRKQGTDWEKVLVKGSDNGLLSKIHVEF